MATKKDNSGFDFIFAASLFLQNHYTLRHVYSLEKTDLEKAYKELETIDFPNLQLLFQAFINYDFYMNSSKTTDYDFGYLPWNKLEIISYELNKNIDDFIDIYENLTPPQLDAVKSLTYKSYEHGIYVSDIYFYKNIFYKSFEITTENLLKNSPRLFFKKSFILPLIDCTGIKDCSDNYLGFTDKPKISFIIDVANMFDKNKKGIKSINYIYFIYNLDKIYTIDTPSTFFDKNFLCSLFPKLLKRITPIEVNNKILGLYLWDENKINNKKLDDVIDTLCNSYPDDINTITNNYKRLFTVTKKSIKANAIITTKSPKSIDGGQTKPAAG